MSKPGAEYDAYVQVVRSKSLAEMQQVIPKVREIYDSGTPFFTKEAMRRIVQQIDDIEKGKPGTVSVVGIDGNIVQLPVQTGEVESDIGTPGIEMVYVKARLAYQTVEHLTGIKDPLFLQSKFAYLPFQIAYITEYRNSINKTLITETPLLCFDKVQDDFQRRRAKWEASNQCCQLKSILRTVASKIPPVQKIVVFACSTMTWDDGSRHRSAVQHALILTIRDFLAQLKSSHNINIKCYAQDPLYTTIDKQVLHEAGITVLDDPKGFLEIDETTVIISQAPDIPVREVTADITKPAMMIWNKVVQHNGPPPTPKDSRVISLGLWADPVSSRLLHMVKDYIELDFPEDPINFCKDTCIYIRKTDGI
ncbi:hypothetical protein NPX13_g5875 [Xylaria arbuscula]|uniref:SRR1-like domain-containing protein n=1 Tax=Xylaria arbuscula TaxID=114810 RepID=A0A9W8ND81_9PEZI|nr:hypothetical protein NPX13_g5875 [Xylaria arbuscula]